MDLSPVIADALQPTTAWNEQACLQGCVRNDIASQGQFYKHFYPRMMAIVLRYTQDKDVACSILNNGFLKAFRNIQSFRNEGSLEGWLRKITVHAISDYFRYKHPPKEILHDVVPDTPNAIIPDHVAHDYKLLLKILSNLPPATRTVVNLFIIDGYTHKEIAGMMNISENTSKWHVSEGRKILQQQLSFVKK
jgi:RNA polymerase sigma factor (sigma-70 family)